MVMIGGEKEPVVDTLAEIGPRFILTLIKIFQGSFGGAVLYTNPNYVSPNEVRNE